MDKENVVHTHNGVVLSIKEGEIMKSAVKQMQLEKMISTEVTQVLKDKCCMFSLICRSQVRISCVLCLTQSTKGIQQSKMGLCGMDVLRGKGRLQVRHVETWDTKSRKVEAGRDMGQIRGWVEGQPKGRLQEEPRGSLLYHTIQLKQDWRDNRNRDMKVERNTVTKGLSGNGAEGIGQRRGQHGLTKMCEKPFQEPTGS